MGEKIMFSTVEDLTFFLRYMYPQKTKKKNQKTPTLNKPKTNQELQINTYIWKN